MALMGVDNYFDKNKRSLLILSTFLIIMISYYYSVGSIICIILYGIYKYIDIHENIKLKSFIKDGIKFLIPLIVSIMMSMVIILPTLYAIQNGRPDITNSVNIMNLFIPKLNISEILYNSYTIGTTSILLVAILYGYMSKKNDRFLSIIFTLIILFPIIIYLLSGSMYVRGKVLIPLLPLAILIVTRFLNKMKNNKTFNILLIILSLIEIYIHLTKQEYIFTLDVLLTLIGYYIYIKKNNKNYLIYTICVCALVCTLVSNFSERLVSKESLSIMYDSSNYDKLNKLLEEDENIYRVGNNLLGMKNYNRVVNINYYLPSIYSSLENPYYYELSNSKIGNELEENIQTALSSTKNILFNTLMGTKYMITDYAPIGYKNIEGDIYINDNVLPIGYSTPKILDYNTYENLDYPEKAYALSTNIILDTKEIEYKSMTKEENIGYEAIYDNITLDKEDEKYIINSQNNGNMTINLDKKYENKILFITFDMEYSESCKIGDTSITINGVKNTLACRTWTYHNKNYKFEYTISGSRLDITFAKGKYIISNIKTYTLDYDHIINFVNNVDEFKIDKEKTVGDEIVGEINVNENGYFILTVPYEEKGFTIYLDEHEIPYERVNDAFIGFPIHEGHHNIRISYTSPYLSQGLVISMIGFMIYIPFIYSDIFKKKTKVKNK